MANGMTNATRPDTKPCPFCWQGVLRLWGHWPVVCPWCEGTGKRAF